jgi:hypothetical protein
VCGAQYGSFLSFIDVIFTFHVHRISVVRSLCKVFTAAAATTTTTSSSSSSSSSSSTNIIITIIVIMVVTGGSWNDYPGGSNGPGGPWWGS